MTGPGRPERQPLPWWAWLQLDELGNLRPRPPFDPTKVTGALNQLRLPSAEDIRQRPDIAATRAVPPEGVLPFGEPPAELARGRGGVRSPETKAAERRATYLEALQRRREELAGRYGPGVMGFVEGARTTLAPLLPPGTAREQESIRAQEMRELAREGYETPSGESEIQRGGAAGPIGRALGARTVGETGEVLGELAGSAPYFVGAGPAAGLAEALTVRGLSQLGVRGLAKGALAGAARGVTEFGVGSALLGAGEAALAKEDPRTIIQEATAAGLAGATSPLALLHVPAAAGRARAVTRRVTELRRARAARMTGELVPGAARLPPLREGPGVRELLEPVTAEPGAALAGAAVGGAVGAQGPQEGRLERAIAGALAGTIAGPLLRRGAERLAPGRVGGTGVGPLLEPEPPPLRRTVGEFRSRMVDQIRQSKFERGTPNQWTALLRGTVNQAEVRDTGLHDWLEAQPKDKSVTRDQVLGAARDLQVREVRLTERPTDEYRVQERQVEELASRTGEARTALRMNLTNADVHYGNRYTIPEQIADNAKPLPNGVTRPMLYGLDGLLELHPLTPEQLQLAEEVYRTARQHIEGARALQRLGGPPEYSNESYRLPGGDVDYQEIVVAAPPTGGVEAYQPGHFAAVKNQVGWMRLNRREIGGARTIFSEEYQSETHQKGRKAGYRDPVQIQALAEADRAAAAKRDAVFENIRDEIQRALQVEPPVQGAGAIEAAPTAPVSLAGVRIGAMNGRPNGTWSFNSNWRNLNTGEADLGLAIDVVRRDLVSNVTRAEGLLAEVHNAAPLGTELPPDMQRPGEVETAVGWAYKRSQALASASTAAVEAANLAERAREGIPPIPYQKTEDWLGLLLRRQIAEAIASGATKIGWTRAATQAARWSQLFRDQIDTVRWNRATHELQYTKDGHRVQVAEEGRRAETLDQLAHIMGRDVAVKLDKATPETGWGELTGQDIAVGADFFQLIYEKMAPKVAKDYVRKLGIKGLEPKVEPMAEAGVREGYTQAAVRDEAQNVRGELRDFLNEVADELPDEDVVEQGDITDAIEETRNIWADRRFEELRDNAQPEIPDLDYFEEGARDYIMEEFGGPLQDVVNELYEKAVPAVARGGKPTAAQLLEILEENKPGRNHAHRDVWDEVEKILNEYEPDQEVSRTEMEHEIDVLTDARVEDQAINDRDNYEPEPIDENALQEQASEYAQDLAERAENRLSDLTTGPPETPGTAWTLDITPELAQKFRSGEGAYLYTGLDPTRLGGLPPEITGAIVGGAAGAATTPEGENVLGRAAIGATLGAVGARTISRALKERRIARLTPEAIRAMTPEQLARLPGGRTPPLEASAAAPATIRVEPPGIAAPSVRAEPYVFAGRQKPVVPEDYVNLAKFDTDPAGAERLKQEVARVVTATGIHPKQVVPWEETRRLAAQLGLDVNDKTLGAVNRRLTGPEMLAIRNIVSANIEALERLSQRRAILPERSEPAQLLDRQITALEYQNGRLLERFIRARTQTGRDLNNLKIIANRTLDPQVWLTQAQKYANRDLTADEVTTISRLAEQRDRAKLARYVADLRQSTPFEKLTTLWKAGLLTNPKTHVINITSNTTMAALELAKDPVAALADRLLSLASGERTKGGWNASTVRAGAKGALEGLREAREALRGGPTSDVLAKYDLPHETNFDNAFLDTYTKTVFRLLGAEDRVFWWTAFRRSLAEQATVAGRNQGLRGVKLREYVDGVQKGQGLLADELTTQAMADAEVATFRDRTPLGDIASYAGRRFAPFQFIVPFTRTPAAVATSVLRYSPAGLGKAAVWDLPRFLTAVARGKSEIGGVPLKVVQRQLAEAVGRGTVGSAAIWLGYLLAQDDLATGAAPTLGTKERQQWLQENRQANSVRVGDTWLNVGRISPVGNLIALGANLRRVWDPKYGPKTPVQRYGELTAAALRTVADQPFLTGVSGAMGALQQPEREAARFVQGLEASAVPAIVGATARGLDPTARLRQGTAGPVMERIPGLRQQLPEQVTPLGTPVQRGPTSQPAAFLDALFNPFTAAPDLRARDPLIRELADAGYAVPRLPQGKGEGAIAYSRRQQLYGRVVREVLSATIESPEYAALREQEQAVAQQAQQLAKLPQWANYPVELIEQALTEALKAESGQPVTRAEALQRLVTSARAQLTRATAAVP